MFTFIEYLSEADTPFLVIQNIYEGMNAGHSANSSWLSWIDFHAIYRTVFTPFLFHPSMLTQSTLTRP